MGNDVISPSVVVIDSVAGDVVSVTVDVSAVKIKTQTHYNINE